MKKILTTALMVVSVGLVTSSAKADASKISAAANGNAEPQIIVRSGNRRRNRRVYRTTRISPNGRRVVTRTYRANGRRVVVRKRVIRRPYRRY